MKRSWSTSGSPFRRSSYALSGRVIVVLVLLIVQIVAVPAKTRTNDIMGAHFNSGRGCRACHSPHEQSLIEASSSPIMLWGNNAAVTYAIYGGGSLQAPAGDGAHNRGVLSCLSCHDGNYAPRAMMRNVVYESLPDAYNGGHFVPTFADRDDFNTGNTIENHPMDSAAELRCGSAMGWDCLQSHGAIRMRGTSSSRFAANYGFFIEPAHTGDTSFVYCTTCHNPHSMTWTAVTAEKASSFYPVGEYPTKHFLRAPLYDAEGASSTTSNRRAQFCRQCHADKSNEMNGSLAGTHP